MSASKGAWPRREVMFWQQAPFFRLLLPLIAGIFGYAHAWPPPWFIAAKANGLLPGQTSKLLLGICLFCLVLFVVLQKAGTPAKPLHWLRFISLNLFFFLAGWLICFFNDVRSQPRWYGHQPADSSYYLACITEAPKELAKTWKLQVQLLSSITNGKQQQPVTGKAFLLVYKKDAPLFQQGDTLLFPGRWTPVTNSSNPFAFDYVTFCRRQGIYHQVFAGPNEITFVGRARPEGFSPLWRIHNYCTQQLKRYLPDKATFGLLQAMLMGDERDFDPELRQAYADTGVVHIVSISGSHTAVLFMVVTWLFFWLRKARYQWIKYACGVGIVWLYVLVAGAPPSALRSAVMFSVFALSFMLEREQHPINTLLMAAFVLLVYNPMYLFAIGFQLSFVAVLSLILFYQPIVNLWPQHTFLGRKLWQLTAASLAVEILIAPLVAFYFHNFPVLVPAANIAAFLLVGFVALLGGLSILAFSWWPWLAHIIGTAVSFCVTWFNKLVWLLQGWSPVAFKFLNINLPELLLLYATILCLSVFFFKKKKPALFLGLSSLILFQCLLLRDQIAAQQQQKLLVYQVNQRALIDLIQGKSYLPLGSDTAGRDHRIALTARTGFSAWRKSRNTLPHAFVLNGKKVLLWEAPFLPTTTLPVDVLILSDSLKHFSLSRLQAAFPAKQMVVTGAQSRWLLQQWKDSAARRGQAFHATLLDGAYVME